IRARAEFGNPRGILRPGMFARARLSVDTGRPRLLIPEKSLVELQGRTFAWVVEAGNLAHQTPVQVEPRRVDGQAVVVDGLVPGQRLVVEGLQKVREGLPVQPRTGEEIARAAAAPHGRE
ncbi:MAG: efflux RND transporter periplasmic adaptor subunit, partial [Verrucomicrobiota bacterium]